MGPWAIVITLCAIGNSQQLGIDEAVSAGYSEIITVSTQGEWTSVIDNAQTNCPWDDASLSLSTWSFGSSGSVEIPSGSHILLTATSIAGNSASNTFDRISIQPNASVIFADESMTLHVREILNLGHLRIGSETCRILNDIHIIFYGNSDDSSVSNNDRSITSKGIISDGDHAVLDIHGKRYHPTWTKLAYMANVNDTSVTVQDSVNWEVGQEIMITTSIWFDCPDFYEEEWCKQCYGWEKNYYPDNYCLPENVISHQNEVRSITAITSNNVLTLNESLNYQHYAGKEYQAEVVLLSRNVMLEGDMDAVSNVTGFGGHLLSTGNSIIRVSGTQANHMGQLNVLGRYPFHMHLLGDAPDSYFMDNSVTNSFFRCYVVHGTHNSLLTRNIAYNAMGMCYYIEDGVEENNTLSYNFAGHIHPIYIPSGPGGGQSGYTHSTIEGIGYDALAVPVDASASGFYISNAWNTIIGNAASGGWSGFAFPNIPDPLGDFYGTSTNQYADPMNRPTKQFEGNSAHSSGFYWHDHGACMYCGAWLTQIGTSSTTGNPLFSYISGREERSTTDLSGNEEWMKFYNTKTYLCQRGITHWGNQIEIYHYEAYDIWRGAELFGEAGISDAIICGHSGNEKGWLSTEGILYGERNGFRGYDTSVKTILNNVIFRNYKMNVSNEEAGYALNSYAYVYNSGSDQFIPQGINAVNNVTFQDCDAKSRLYRPLQFKYGVEHDSLSSKLYSVYDYDGSLTQSGVPSIVGSNMPFWNVDDDECNLDPYANLYRCDWDRATRQIGWVELYIDGLYDGCQSDQVTNASQPCSGQYASYFTGYVSQWGVNRSMSIGPWAGVSGIADIGWYWRPVIPSSLIANYDYDTFVGGSPSYFEVGNGNGRRGGVQLEHNHFIVLAMRYPKGSSFRVRIQESWWGNTKTVMGGDLPMSDYETVTSLDEGYTDPYNNDAWNCSSRYYDMCYSFGGAIGPAWYYDEEAEFLYIRVVNFFCYASSYRLGCSESYVGDSNEYRWRNWYSFSDNNVRLWDVKSNWYFAVNVTCDSCTVAATIDNIDYYEISDEIPACKLRDYACQQGTTQAPSKAPTVEGYTYPPSVPPTLGTTADIATDVTVQDGESKAAVFFNVVNLVSCCLCMFLLLVC